MTENDVGWLEELLRLLGEHEEWLKITLENVTKEEVDPTIVRRVGRLLDQVSADQRSLREAIRRARASAQKSAPKTAAGSA